MGHTAALYKPAKNKLLCKYSGMRGKIELHFGNLDQFKPVPSGQAKDAEKLTDLLDMVVVNLLEGGHTEELVSELLYIKVQKKLSEFMLSNYKMWVFEKRAFKL